MKSMVDDDICEDEATDTDAVLESHARMGLVRALTEMALASQDAAESGRYAELLVHEVGLYTARRR